VRRETMVKYNGILGMSENRSAKQYTTMDIKINAILISGNESRN
jgi:hypothetical protein